MTYRLLPRALALAGLVAAAAASSTVPAMAEEGIVIPRSAWTFSGISGRFDKPQLQRGFQVFKERCSTCHSANYLRFRNLGEPGGPGFVEGQVKTLAAEKEVADGVDDTGKVVMRPGRPADTWPGPYGSEKEARAANGGALPPDFSLLAFSREAPAAGFEPARWFNDITKGYQEGGTDYVHMLLQGYAEKPPAYHEDKGHLVELPEAEAKADSVRCASVTHSEDGKATCNELLTGLYYNKYFPGHQIAMPKPLNDGDIKYSDGSPETVAQYSSDVAAFLMWLGDPQLEERKGLGLRTLLYLIGLAVLLWFAKQQVWSRLKGH
jgi:ubiquinol-cytochrome c reductase cytochrome c1 subunit